MIGRRRARRAALSHEPGAEHGAGIGNPWHRQSHPAPRGRAGSGGYFLSALLGAAAPRALSPGRFHHQGL
jgi:hypothetical protein